MKDQIKIPTDLNPLDAIKAMKRELGLANDINSIVKLDSDNNVLIRETFDGPSMVGVDVISDNPNVIRLHHSLQTLEEYFKNPHSPAYENMIITNKGSLEGTGAPDEKTKAKS